MSDWERPRFRSTSWRQPGYDAAEVDDFLDALFRAIASGAPPPDILEQRFTVRRFGGGGYDMDEVDAFLDEVHRGLAG